MVNSFPASYLVNHSHIICSGAKHNGVFELSTPRWVLDPLVVLEHALLSIFLMVVFCFGEANDALVASRELDGVLRPGV